MRCRQVVQTNPSRYSFKLVMILAKRTMLDGSPPSAVRLQTASSIAIDLRDSSIVNQESIWLQEIENPQTIMCGSSCVSNHRNPEFERRSSANDPYGVQENSPLSEYTSKLTLQQNPVNSLARNTIKWRKYIHALCETGFARTGYWGAAVFEPSITVCFICWSTRGCNFAKLKGSVFREALFNTSYQCGAWL